jgi:hypothetical protein
LSSTSRIGPLIDYLVNAFSNAATLGAATPPVLVFDGPPTTADPAPLALHVGMDDLFSDQAPTSATSEQIRQGYGQHRQETVTIHCAAVAWAGTDDMRTVRTAAFAIVAAVEDLIRTDASKFGGNADQGSPGVSGGTLQQNNTAQGAVAQVTFTITFISFIGS